MKIKEITEELAYKDHQQLLIEITNLILQYESKLTRKMILHDIDIRNKEGEGIMSPKVLSLHVQDELVERDIAFYITLDKDFKYLSRQLDKKFKIRKLVVIVVNPNHQLDHLSKLEEFLAD